jgi:hypothetical protein
MTSQLLADAQIKTHIGLSFDRFYPAKINISSIPPMIDALVDGVTTTLLQMRCDRRGPLSSRQKQQEHYIADRVNVSAKPDDVCPPPPPLV